MVRMQTNKQELVICIILWFMFDLPVSTGLHQKLILDYVFSKSNYYILLITYRRWWA